MSRLPGDRFASPGEVAKALQSISKDWQQSTRGQETELPKPLPMSSQSPTIKTAETTSPRKNANSPLGIPNWMAAGLGGLLVTGLILYAISNSDSPPAEDGVEHSAESGSGLSLIHI